MADGTDRPIAVSGRCTPAQRHRAAVFRAVIRLSALVGDGAAIGNLQSIIAGAHPEIGLTEEASSL